MEKVLLTNMAINLQQRSEWRSAIAQQPEEDLVGLFDDAFELGYQTARMYGEYQLKVGVEESALVGMKARKDQERRAQAAGKASHEKRAQRVDSLLSKMEEIAGRNPDIARLNPRVLADLAMSDVIHADPDLWKQGKGRRDEYLDEMSVDIRYRERFKEIFE